MVYANEMKKKSHHKVFKKLQTIYEVLRPIRKLLLVPAIKILSSLSYSGKSIHYFSPILMPLNSAHRAFNKHWIII